MRLRSPLYPFTSLGKAILLIMALLLAAAVSHCGAVGVHAESLAFVPDADITGALADDWDVEMTVTHGDCDDLPVGSVADLEITVSESGCEAALKLHAQTDVRRMTLLPMEQVRYECQAGGDRVLLTETRTYNDGACQAQSQAVYELSLTDDGYLEGDVSIRSQYAGTCAAPAGECRANGSVSGVRHIDLSGISLTPRPVAELEADVWE